jgi:hypothetical protein
MKKDWFQKVVFSETYTCTCTKTSAKAAASGKQRDRPCCLKLAHTFHKWFFWPKMARVVDILLNLGHRDCNKSTRIQVGWLYRI